ncbi:MAG: DUF1697 domain-containing protein [Ignavibacteriaceae bacterium]|nr:DUF1697 domain-containing protein [Ignavibacteriaceae bacterium]
MKKYVALLRGINVGGKNIIPMNDLKLLFEKLKFKEVQTYIQSGNVIFESDETDTLILSRKIAIGIQKNFNLNVKAFILSCKDLFNVIKSNPFSGKAESDKYIHVFFLDKKVVNVEIEKLKLAKKHTEEFILKDKLFYLYAPEGIGRSKLAARVERVLRVSVTARNWRSINEIAKLIVRVTD